MRRLSGTLRPEIRALLEANLRAEIPALLLLLHLYSGSSPRG